MARKRAYLLAAALAAILSLTACQTSLPPTTVGTDSAYWSAATAHNAALSSVLLRGRMGVTTADGSTRLNFTLDMQDRDRYTLTLTTAVGTTAARFKVEGKDVSLTADGITYTGASIGELFSEHFDVTLPEGDLASVLLARPMEGMVFDETGKPLGVNLFPCQFLYTDFQGFGPYALPKGMLMRSPDVRLNLEIRDVERIR